MQCVAAQVWLKTVELVSKDTACLFKTASNTSFWSGVRPVLTVASRSAPGEAEDEAKRPDVKGKKADRLGGSERSHSGAFP